MRISDWSSDVCSSDLAIKVIILAGNGKNFSAGHDIGTPERDAHESFEREHLLPDHVGKPGAEFQLVREQEVHLGMCRRWRDIPKPTIAMVQDRKSTRLNSSH